MTGPNDQNGDESGEQFAVLGMYPFAKLRPAWEQLFVAVADRVRESGHTAAAGLSWDVDPHDSWLRPGLTIGMTCGWPLVTALREQVHVVGTFAYRGADAPQPQLYRSVIVGREESRVSELAGRRAAINSEDSLSGNISLLDVFGLGASWPGEVVWTSTHLSSLEAVRSGAADVASIDGMTWAYQERDEPTSVERLRIVARGPWVPGLPLILPVAASDAVLAAWRAAFCHSVTDPTLVDVMHELMIEDFVPLDLADYDRALTDLQTRHPVPAAGTDRRVAGAERTRDDQEADVGTDRDRPRPNHV